MTDNFLTAQQVYDLAPRGSLVGFSDGTVEPPARHRRKHAAWASTNATGRLVTKAPGNHGSAPSFELHIGNFGSDDVTRCQGYHTFAVSSSLSSSLSYAILDRPRPGQAAVLQDENGIPTLIHLADTAADAETWLKGYPHRNARVVPADTPEPRAFTYLQDPGHGWLIVNKADLVSAGMSSADITVCSYVREDSLALDEAGKAEATLPVANLHIRRPTTDGADTSTIRRPP